MRLQRLNRLPREHVNMTYLSVALIQQYAPHEGKHATYETIAPPERHPRECVQQMDQHDQQQQTADRGDPYTEAQREPPP